MMHSNVIMIIIIIVVALTIMIILVLGIIIIIFFIMLLCIEIVSMPYARVVCQLRMGRESHVSLARLGGSCAKDCCGILMYRT